MHFNENVHRDKVTGEDGQPLTKVTYPKYKFGEEVVRDVQVAATYGNLLLVLVTL